MINIKQLRLGNYVMYEQTTHVVTSMSRTLIETHWDGGTENYIHLPEELDPIPLTEEILLKCGFQKVNHVSGYTFWTYNRKKRGVNFICDIYERWTKINGMIIPSHIEYLHQLQNLYFAICGVELEFNNTKG